MKQIQALVLAGGIGKRMWPISTNKSLLKFLGKPIMEYNIDDLIFSGIRKLIIVSNPENKKEINDICLKKSIAYKIIIQKEAKGMADALIQAKVDLTSNPLLIINASDLFKQNFYKDFLQQAVKEKIILGGMETDSYLEGAYFKFKGNKLIGLVEKPGKENQPSNFFKPVVDYFENPNLIFSYLTKATSDKDDLYEVALNLLIKNGDIKLYKIESFFQQIKYPWHILLMMNKIFNFRMSNLIAKDSKLTANATIKNKVIIESGVKIMEGAIINGPAYIGKNTVIGNNALVRNSMIGANCVVGYNTEICRSWVGENNWFHCNYIGDSVIESRCNFGSGAKTANLRLDEKEIYVYTKEEKINSGLQKLGAIIGKNVKVGINASLMPGVLIGQASLIGPGKMVQKNLEDRAKAL